MRYDPDVAPLPLEWLTLHETERIAVVEQSHAVDVPNLPLHVAIHAAVETQIAMYLPSVVAAAERLQAEGLDRHNTIHAIGAVLATHMWSMATADPEVGDPNTQYYAALDQLSTESWRRDYDSSFGSA